MVSILEIQPVFYLGYSKRNITSECNNYNICSSTCPSEKNLLVDKSDNVLYRITGQIWQLLQLRYGLVGKTNGRGTTIVFPFERCGQKVVRCFYNIFWT